MRIHEYAVCCCIHEEEVWWPVVATRIMYLIRKPCFEWKEKAILGEKHKWKVKRRQSRSEMELRWLSYQFEKSIRNALHAENTTQIFEILPRSRVGSRARWSGERGKGWMRKTRLLRQRTFWRIEFCMHVFVYGFGWLFLHRLFRITKCSMTDVSTDAIGKWTIWENQFHAVLAEFCVAELFSCFEFGYET